MRRWSLFIFAVAVFKSSLSVAGVYYASSLPEGREDCTSLENSCDFQTALSSAATDGEDSAVYLKPGTYQVSFTFHYVTDDGDGSLLIAAAEPENPPVLDGGGAINILYINNDRDDDRAGDEGQRIVVKDLIFQNGFQPPVGTYSSSCGNGLYVKAGAADVRVEGSEFLNGRGEGALCITTTGQIEVVRNKIVGNYTGGYGAGAVIYSHSAPTIIAGNLFVDNTAYYNGGGLLMGLADGTRLVGNTFFNNEAGYYYAGGAYLIGDPGVNIYFYNNIFWENYGNYGGGSAFGNDINVELSGSPGAVTFYFYNNNSACDTWAVDNFCIYIITGLTTAYVEEASNVTGNPWFKDPASGDYTPSASSPCIDAGHTEVSRAHLFLDLEGKLRVLDGDGDGVADVDIGAFEYAPEGYTFTVAPVPASGTVYEISGLSSLACGEEGDVCSAFYPPGISLRLLADAGVCYLPHLWGGDCSACGSNPQCTVNLDREKTCTVSFTRKKFTVISGVKGEGGTVSPSGVQTVECGSTVEFVFTPPECHFLRDVSGTCGGALDGERFYTNPVTQDCMVEGVFALKTYYISAFSTYGGSVTPSGQVSVNCGEDVTFIITPDQGFEVKDVIVDGVSAGPVTTYTFSDVKDNHWLKVEFVSLKTGGCSCEMTGPDGGSRASIPEGVFIVIVAFFIFRRSLRAGCE